MKYKVGDIISWNHDTNMEAIILEIDWNGWYACEYLKHHNKYMIHETFRRTGDVEQFTFKVNKIMYNDIWKKLNEI